MKRRTFNSSVVIPVTIAVIVVGISIGMSRMNQLRKEVERPMQLAPAAVREDAKRPYIGMGYDEFKRVCTFNLHPDDHLSMYESAAGDVITYDLAYLDMRRESGCFGRFQLVNGKLASISR